MSKTQEQVDNQMKGVNDYNAAKHEGKMEVMRAMRDDNLRGMTKTEIKDKFFAGKYGKDFSKNADGGRNAFNKYWKDMNQTFFEDFDEPSKEDLRKRIIAKYMHAYGWFVGQGNMQQARKTLDSLAKVAGLDQSNEKPTLNIDGKEVKISFGLDNNSGD